MLCRKDENYFGMASIFLWNSYFRILFLFGKKWKLYGLNIDGTLIKYIKNPSVEFQLAAVRGFSGAEAILCIKDYPIEVELISTQRRSRSIRYMKYPSVETQLYSVSEYAASATYIKSPTIEIMWAAVNQSWENILYLINVPEEIKLKAKMEYENMLLPSGIDGVMAEIIAALAFHLPD